MKHTRKQIAERAEKLLAKYWESKRPQPRKPEIWYAAAVWVVQWNLDCEKPFTQMELADLSNTLQGNISNDAWRLRAWIKKSRTVI